MRGKLPGALDWTVTSVLNSYAQVFFSKNKWFALLLVLVTFIDPVTGLAGLVAVLAANGFALLLGYGRYVTREGNYGFNALLAGLGLGIYFAPNISFYVLLVSASLMCVLVTAALSGVLGKYGLPYLSVPFLLIFWTVFLAARNFEAIGISERGVYVLNELYATGSNWLVKLYQDFNAWNIPIALKIYFKSLGAILFQYNLLSGMLIALGLLFYSRIAFTLSLLGFLAAYGFYQFIGADLNELSYSYIGFNFILSAIAVGGFFLIPSRQSYLWALVLIPLLVLLTSALASLFAILQLGIYSLPFNIVVLTFLYALKLRPILRKPYEVIIQEFSPERNLYNSLSYAERYKYARPVNISLPVMGPWTIDQGHNGDITHKGEWRYAFDFVIRGEDDNTWSGKGESPEDFLAWNQPVVAPAPGTVELVEDGIDDNPIGEVNLLKNWGNTIVIRHGHQLYSQISHLKKGSIKVKPGDVVERGELIAHCGNSGRSPEPHVHFQIQTTPYIGSRTFRYPLGYYLVLRENDPVFHLYGFPETHEVIQRVQPEDLMVKAFRFITGETITWEIRTGEHSRQTIAWEVVTDWYNNNYLLCRETGSRAWFVNDGMLHLFTHFEGDRNSLLFQFYLAAYKVLLSVHPEVKLRDVLPLYQYSPVWLRSLHDFLAPVKNLIAAFYELTYHTEEDTFGPGKVVLDSRVQISWPGGSVMKRHLSLFIETEGIRELVYTIDGKEVRAVWRG